MHLARSGLVIVTALASSADALRTAPGSPCSKDCGNVLSATTPDDMECFDDPSRYSSTAAGIVLKTCITCQMTSTYVSDDGQSDLQWLLYNLRYTSSTCLFGFPNNEAKKLNTGPCGTRTACEPFKESLQWQNLSTTAKPYDYCKLWDEFQFTKCSACLAPGHHYVAANLMTMLDAGCRQTPEAGRVISVSDAPFTSSIIKFTDPSLVGSFKPDEGPLTLGAKVGIAVAGVVLLLLAAGCGIICNGKRRRRAFLRNLQKRQAQDHVGGGFGGGSSRGRWPGSQGGDMFETPVSQKPLFTSWEQSPVSAHTDQTGFSTGLSPAVEKGGPGGAGPSSFPTRYFSPYSSQFNSPVSGQESTPTQWPQPDGQPQPQQAGISGGLSPGGWPSSTQEKLFQLAQMQQEQEEAYRMQIALHQQQLAQQQQQQQQQQQPQRQQQQQQPQHQPGGLYPQDIGLAFGGDDPSLRSKASAQSMQSHEGQQQQQQYPPPPQQPQQYHSQTSPWGFSDIKGKQADYYQSEEYELHEVDSNGSARVPSGTPAAPMLNHPGYGRYPPPPAPATMRPQW